MLPEFQNELINNGLVLHRTTEGLYAYQIEKIIGNKVILNHDKNTAFKIVQVSLPNPHILAHTGVMPASTPIELPINKIETPLFNKTKNISTLSELLQLLSTDKYNSLFIPLKKKKERHNQYGFDDTSEGDNSNGFDANSSAYNESKIRILKQKLEELTHRKVKLI